MTITGVDGYRGGWVAASVVDQSVTWTVAPVPSVGALINRLCSDVSDVMAIDMPIGILDRGWRECDVTAKGTLGSAGSRVFLTPPRGVLELGLETPNGIVQTVSRRLTGQGTSRQAMGLAERILALDSALRSGPAGSVIETHPELSFAEMTGAPLLSKKSAAGVAQRMSALQAWLPEVVGHLESVPADVPVDDALDALACAWSAQRYRDGASRSIPAAADLPPFIAI